METSKGGSAFFGEPPLTKHDANIMIGLFGSTKPPKRVKITEPGSKGPQLLIGMCFAISLTFIFTAGRLMTRALRKGQVFGADDWVIIPAVLIVLAYFIDLAIRVPYACAGKHLNYCTYKEIGLFFELGGIGQVMFFAASTLIKISMTLFNRRLTGMTSRRWQIVHYSFLSLLIVWFFITLFINIFQCTPVTAFFNFSLQVDTPSYHCLASNKINYAFVVINAVTDFCLLFVPVIIIARVRMPFWRRARLVAIFLLGSICCIASTCRIVFIHRSSKDFTYKFPQNVSLTVVDLFFGALVANLPALNAFAELLFQKTKTKISGYYGSTTGRTPANESGSGGTGASNSATRSGSRPSGKGFSGFVRASSRGGDSTTRSGLGGTLDTNKEVEIEEDTFVLPAHANAHGRSDGPQIDLEHGAGQGGFTSGAHGIPVLRSESSANSSNSNSPTIAIKKQGGARGPFVSAGETGSFFSDDDDKDAATREKIDAGDKKQKAGPGSGYEMKSFR